MFVNDKKEPNDPAVKEPENTVTGFDSNMQVASPDVLEKQTKEQEISQQEATAAIGIQNNPPSDVQAVLPDVEKPTSNPFHDGNSAKGVTVTYGEGESISTPFGSSVTVSKSISFTEMQKISGDVSHSLVSAEILCLIYAMILKFGCLTREQVKSILTENSILDNSIENFFTVIICNNIRVYFHDLESLARYAELGKQPLKEIKSKAVFVDMVDMKTLEQIIQDIDILLAFDKYCQTSKKFRFYSWVSSTNPRSVSSDKRVGKSASSSKARQTDKSKSPIKINRPDRGKSFEPHLVVGLEAKNTCFALVFDKIYDFPWLSLEEKKETWEETITGYARWLNDKKKLSMWLRKTGLFYAKPETVCVALYLSSKEPKTAERLVQYCQKHDITAPIYIASGMEDIISHPFSCWSTNCAKNIGWL